MLSEKLEFSLANNSGIAELEFTFSFNLYKFFIINFFRITITK